MRGLLLLLVLLALPACGFTPLYSTQGPTSVRGEMRGVGLGSLQGPPLASRHFYDAMQEALPGNESDTSSYKLDIALRESIRAIGVTRSADTTRYDYFLRARATLVDLESGQRRGTTIETVVSYGVVPSQFASLLGREDAVRRAAIDLARRIELDTALYLAGKAPRPSTIEGTPNLDGELIEGSGEGFEFRDEDLEIDGEATEPVADTQR